MATGTDNRDSDRNEKPEEPAVRRESADWYIWVHRNCRWVCVMLTEAMTVPVLQNRRITK